MDIRVTLTIDEYSTILSALNELRFRISNAKPQNADHAAQIRTAINRVDKIVDKIDNVLLDAAD